MLSERSKCQNVNTELGWCISSHLTAGCDRSPWACSGMYLCILRSGRWLKNRIAFLCFLHVSASAATTQSKSDVYWCTFKRVWSDENYLQETMKNGVVDPPSKLLFSSTSCFLNEYLLLAFWHFSAQVSATIHLPLSLCIHRGSCLWQKQWQVTGAMRINHPLPSTANKCKHLPSHTDTQLCGCIHPVH